MSHVEIINTAGDPQQIDFASYVEEQTIIYLNCVRPPGFVPQNADEQLFLSGDDLPDGYKHVYRAFLRNYRMSTTPVPPLYYVTFWITSPDGKLILQQHFLVTAQSRDAILMILKQKSNAKTQEQQQQQAMEY